MVDKRAIFIKTDGSMEQKDDKPTLEEMQAFVGGPIEPVQVFYEGRACRMVLNEEGLRKGLPVNPRATQLYHAMGGNLVVGNVIVLQGYKV